MTPVHGRRDGRFGLVAGSSVPADAIGCAGRNGAKLRWAVTGSNRRPSRCKREIPAPNRRFLTISKSKCANLSLLAHARGGSNGTGQTFRKIRARDAVRRTETRMRLGCLSTGKPGPSGCAQHHPQSRTHP